jgi:hypothetical protein
MTVCFFGVISILFIKPHRHGSKTAIEYFLNKSQHQPVERFRTTLLCVYRRL